MGCPKCKSRSFIFIEEIVVEEYRHVVDGVPEVETIDIIPAGSIGARCTCACGHSWRPRKYTNFGEMEEHFTPTQMEAG